MLRIPGIIMMNIVMTFQYLIHISAYASYLNVLYPGISIIFQYTGISLTISHLSSSTWYNTTGLHFALLLLYSIPSILFETKMDRNLSIITSSPNGMSYERRVEISHILYKHCQKVTAERRAHIKKAALMAGYCIEDSFQGRLSNGLASNSKKSARMLAIFRLQTSEWLLNLILFASVYHTVCVFFEASSIIPSWVWTINTLLVVSIYSFDAGMKMTYQGVDEYFSHDWQKLYVLSIFVMLLESLCTGRVYFANFLRPSAGVLRSRSGRKFFSIIKKMCSQLSQTFIPMVSTSKCCEWFCTLYI